MLIVAFISGWIAYGLGFAIEPALPWLGGGGGHDERQPGQEHEGGDHDAGSEHAQEPAPDHDQEHSSEHD